MKAKSLLLNITCILVLTACASPYKASLNVLNLKSAMPKDKAGKIVARTLVNINKNEGICAANGHPNAGLANAGWDLNKNNPKLNYNSQGFSFNAFKKNLSITTSGNISTGTYSSTSTTLSPLRRSIKFTDFDDATIFYKMNALNRVCYFDEGYAEVRISLKSGFGHWVSVLVSNKNLETFIAATMVIAPHTIFQTK